MKKIITIIAAALFLTVAFGCTKKASVRKSAGEITVTDHGGNTVIVPAHAKRIAVCDIFPLPSVLAVFFDSAADIVGMAPASMSAAENSLLSELYPEILNAETGFMNGSDVNVEELMKLAPDVVFYSDSNGRLGETLRRAGFCAVGIAVNKWNYSSIETLNHWIELISEIFPQNSRVEQVKNYSNEVYELVRSRVESIPVEERVRSFFLFQYSDSLMLTSGRQFFGQWWADASGLVNVSGELEGDNSVKVNLEQVYVWNPDVIFMTNFTKYMPEDLYENTVGNYDWSGISAVKNRRVYKMPLGMYRSYTPGADTPVTLLWFAKTAYPELFSDIDVVARAVDYYKEVFGINITEKQAESIFAPSADAGKVYF